MPQIYLSYSNGLEVLEGPQFTPPEKKTSVVIAGEDLSEDAAEDAITKFFETFSARHAAEKADTSIAPKPANKIDLFRLIREKTSLGLKESKDLVDQIYAAGLADGLSRASSLVTPTPPPPAPTVIDYDYSKNQFVAAGCHNASFINLLYCNLPQDRLKNLAITEGATKALRNIRETTAEIRYAPHGKFFEVYLNDVFDQAFGSFKDAAEYCYTRAIEPVLHETVLNELRKQVVIKSTHIVYNRELEQFEATTERGNIRSGKDLVSMLFQVPGDQVAILDQSAVSKACGEIRPVRVTWDGTQFRCKERYAASTSLSTLLDGLNESVVLDELAIKELIKRA